MGDVRKRGVGSLDRVACRNVRVAALLSLAWDRAETDYGRAWYYQVSRRYSLTF